MHPSQFTNGREFVVPLVNEFVLKADHFLPYLQDLRPPHHNVARSEFVLIGNVLSYCRHSVFLATDVLRRDTDQREEIPCRFV